jgi:hypothetical protein
VEFLGTFGADFQFRVGSPQGEPALEVLRFEPEAEVAPHAASVEDGSAGVVRPEMDDGLEMGIPVVNMGAEDGTEKVVLAGAVVEPGQEPFEARMAAQTFVE